MRVRLINYFDVWGNPHEGYEVNNLSSVWEKEIKEEELEGRKALLLLRREGFLRSIRGLQAVEYGPGRVEIERKRDGYPIAALEYE